MAHVVESLAELLYGDIQRLAEVDSVELYYVARNHHYVVCRLVIYDEFSVTVVNQAARGVNDFVEESVVVGVNFVFVIAELQISESENVNYEDDDNKSADDVFSFFFAIVFSHGCCVLNCQLQISL